MEEHLDFWIVFLENSLGIDPPIIKLCYDAYTSYDQGASLNTRLVNCAFYKNCILSIGHMDERFDTMLDFSPDCKKFITTLDLAIKESEKIIV